VIASAKRQSAGERKCSQWDPGRVHLLLPTAAVIAAAIACALAAVLASSTHREGDSLAREQLSIQQAIDNRGRRLLSQLQSIATTPLATQFIRRTYDPSWVERNLGEWFQTYFRDDLVAVVDGSDQIKYVRGAAGVDTGGLPRELAPSLALLRGRGDIRLGRAVHVLAAPDFLKPGRFAALVQRFMDKPAIVAAVAVGSDSDLASGNDNAPIVVAVKYIDRGMLASIGKGLELPGLREFAGSEPAAITGAASIVDPRGVEIARLGWNEAPTANPIPWGAFASFATALGGLGVLIFLVRGHLRRSAQTIAAGETQLRHLALHDPVSGLPNRIYFGERLESVLKQVRCGGSTAAVFYIDLDHFKDVNDTLGHHVGDELILSVAQRLRQMTRGEDLAARLGGDEFAIITVCPSDSYSLQALASCIISAVCAPYTISGHDIIIGASIGIAVIDRRAGDAADILRYADMALYRAKNEGRNRACVYDAAMDAVLSQRKLLESDLRHAIRHDELSAVYQPIVNASGDTLLSVEALARWTHPTAGEIQPSEFIPIAEHSGLIVELGEWMLRRACLEGRNWPRLSVAVNVSPIQFRRADFVEMVQQILNETDFDPHRLELELTESTLLGNLETTESSMRGLKAIGVRFALDDFGTGYSSLLYLRRFPFDKLKVDSSFVHSIETAPDAAAIVHAIVSLGRGLGMRVTAEGVENAEQQLFLRAAGVHSMQGYRFGRPGPAADITARLAFPDDYRVGSPDREVALAS
jgi:diguanylate cyclase